MTTLDRICIEMKTIDGAYDMLMSGSSIEKARENVVSVYKSLLTGQTVSVSDPNAVTVRPSK